MPFPLVAAAFAGPQFLGARVRSVNLALGSNFGSPSQLDLSLVNDSVYGLTFSPPDLGTPVYFSFEGLRFNGLLQRWEEGNDASGSPVFRVTVVDPREILDGAQIIIRDYYQGVGGIANLYNAFGYWENQSFGASLTNESGMPWFKIRDAILAMVNSPDTGEYGGPLSFRGVRYGLDLSELPAPSMAYQIGGGAEVSLLEAIAQVCEDGGCDFFIELNALTIKVRTISRASQPPLGTISQIANSTWNGTVSRSSNGLELRNEIASAFLVGGPVTTLWATDTLTQFWGYDINGNPITGTAIDLNLVNHQGLVLETVQTERMNLNAAPVAWIIGKTFYNCTTLEMRLAQANFESWASYVKLQKPDVAAIVGMTSPFNLAAENPVALRPNFVNDNDAAQIAEAEAAAGNDIRTKEMCLFEFVKGCADEYMGRQYLAGLPFILQRTDSDTGLVTTNWEITDAAYLAEDDEPLGLSEANQELFESQDGRIKAFATFADLGAVDLTKISPVGSVIEDDVLYVGITVEPSLIATATNPVALVTLSAPVMERSVDNVGNAALVGPAALGLLAGLAANIFQQCVMPMKVGPAIRHPSSLAIPLRSTILTYGPWYAAGANGKVRFECDPTLVPWNYGGYDAMNTAGNVKVSTAVTSQQVSETATVEVAGAPIGSLGDVLLTGGPNITNIDVQISPQGVTTTYRFQSFTSKFGVMSRLFTEKLKRMSITAMETKKQVRAALKNEGIRNKANAQASRTSRAFMEKQAKAWARETPHDVYHAWNLTDTETGATRTHVSTATMEESIAMSNAHSSGDYPSTAIMGLSGLVRPFSKTANSVMSSYTTPTIAGTIPNKTMLDPWKWDNDIEVYTYGDEYQGLHAGRRGADLTKVRAMGLRAPVVLVGWGFNTEGKCVPSTDGGATWASGTAVRQDTHLSGPLDANWDARRGVWSVHDNYKGYLPSAIAAGGSGVMEVRALDGTNYNITVWNWFAGATPATRKAFASYVATDNRIYVTSVDCTSS